MVIVKDTNELKGKALVATIGFFDGVHQGHRFLIQEMIKEARARNLPSAVITFPQHPRVVLQTNYQSKLLNSFEEKLEHLASTGVDYCIVLDFTITLSELTAQEFISILLADKLNVKALLIGYDHRFGHNRAEGFDQYVIYGKACGMEVLKMLPYDEGKTAVSSSEIRRELLLGHVEKAAGLLTYPYQLKGQIVSGHKVGRKLGFPTANIQVNEPFKVIPGKGIYAVFVNLRTKWHKGMLYIGDRPTLNNGDDVSLEVNILDFSEDVYNNEITVSFMYYIRDDIKFNSLEQLKEQLERDREAVNQCLSL